MFVWNWSSGECLQKIRIPPSQAQGSLLGTGQSHQVTALKSNGSEGSALRSFAIEFDRTGQTFVVSESSTSSVGGGYRVSVWNFARTTNAVSLVSHEDLELQTPCLGLCVLNNTQGTTSAASTLADNVTDRGVGLTGRVSGFQTQSNSQLLAGSHLTRTYLSSEISFLTLEKNCVKIWQFSQGTFELKKRVHIKQQIR